MSSTGSSSSVATEAAPARADLVVGLVSYNSAGTIGPVLSAVRGGLAQGFAGLSSRVVLADAGSTDDTIARARAAVAADLLEAPVPHGAGDLLELPYHGIPGKARVLRGLLAAAARMEARACVIIDARVSTMAPQWLEWLARPVIAGQVDLVSPYYHRQLHEGALTKGIVYPLVRALYGVRLRQPAAAEFACSARLLERVLEEDLWEGEAAQAGIDLWLTTFAATGDFRLAEAALGVRSTHARSEEALDLGATLRQVVGSLFTDLEQRVQHWQRVRGSSPVQQAGDSTPAAASAGADVNVEPFIDSCRLGYRELRDVWTYVLPARTMLALRRLVEAPAAQFRLDDELWAQIVYDFALGHRMRVLPRDHLFGSLVPLYLGWLASFILQVRERGTQSADERVEQLAAAFEEQKPYLISRWRWPERLRT